MRRAPDLNIRRSGAGAAAHPNATFQPHVLIKEQLDAPVPASKRLQWTDFGMTSLRRSRVGTFRPDPKPPQLPRPLRASKQNYSGRLPVGRTARSGSEKAAGQVTWWIFSSFACAVVMAVTSEASRSGRGTYATSSRTRSPGVVSTVAAAAATATATIAAATIAATAARRGSFVAVFKQGVRLLEQRRPGVTARAARPRIGAFFVRLHVCAPPPPKTKPPATVKSVARVLTANPRFRRS
jgi:hypothetical protein